MTRKLRTSVIGISTISILLAGCGSVNQTDTTSSDSVDSVESTVQETEELEVSTSVPEDPLVYYDVDLNESHGVLEKEREEPGIYDAETGDLIISYDELAERYEFSVSTDYTSDGLNLTNILKSENIKSQIKFVLPETDHIGSNLATEAENLVAIDIASGTLDIGDYAFSATGLAEVKLPSSITEINNGAFSNCYSLEKIDLGKSLEYIGMQAFSNDRALTSIDLPDSLETIDNGAFDNVTFDYVDIPDTALVGNYAFYGTNTICYNGKSLDVSEYSIYNTSAIDLFGANKNHSFNRSNTCTLCGETLDYVDYVITAPMFIDHTTGLCDIPSTFEEKGVTYKIIGIANGAYKGCEDIKTVQMKDSIISIDKYAFSECENLSTIALSENLKYIGDGAFSYCNSLTSIYIPSSVPSLYGAFEGCSSLKSVTVPGKISFDCDSFKECISLEEINYGGSEEDWDSQVIGAPAPAMQVDADTMLQDASSSLKIKFNQYN
jgi:hypothetical protein